MPINAQIPLGVQPVQIQQPDPNSGMNALAKVMQIRGLQQDNQLGQLKMDEYQRGVDDQNYLRSALAVPDADPYKVLLQRGKVKEATEFAKGQADVAKNKTETEAKAVETAHKRLDTWGQSMGWLRQNPSAENASAVMQHLVTLGVVPAEMAQGAMARLQANPTPQAIAQFADMGFRSALQAKDQLPKLQTNNTGGQTVTQQIDPVTGKVLGQSALQNTQSPDNAATNATHIQAANISARASRDNNAATINKDYVIAGVKPDGTPVDGGGLLSQESVINAATRYNMDGTLPPNLGRGTQGPRQTAQILNEAARQAAARGDSPEAQRIAQLANKASSQALGTIEKQSTMVGAFEKNFNKNADIALEMSQKVDRTGVPILNKWINAGRRSVAGDADLAAFDANIKATVNEYAKIVGGGSGSGATAQGEIAKIEGLLSAAQTPQQVSAVISLMKRETANRMQAFEEQKTELRNSMIRPGSGKPAPASGGSGKVVNFGDLK